MAGKFKIFNDPVYGFVSIPYGILMELTDHPYFQRLRRIRQLGLASYVYPGALHTRFHHAMGALHLMQQAVDVLLSKGASVSVEEAEAVCIAILLHDIGHGPFSHALEHTFAQVHHEEISRLLMEDLNKQFGGRLTMAIAIFTDSYPKPFLHQLVSGQLDMDRLDYLHRDSFFTGVSEGVISYDRILKMLSVHEERLVVEEKGIYSIEKFLMARRLMYWQVYLHKTGVAAEQMLIHLLARARFLALSGKTIEASRHLRWFLYRQEGSRIDQEEMIRHFTLLDDHDISACIKAWAEEDDPLMAYLAQGLLHRRLFRLEWHTGPIDTSRVAALKDRIGELLGSAIDPGGVVYTGQESNRTYDEGGDPIHILFKNGQVLPIDACSDVPMATQIVTKYFVCYPKLLNL
jgi:HD superfamily phosphohydrolase